MAFAPTRRPLAAKTNGGPVRIEPRRASLKSIWEKGCCHDGVRQLTPNSRHKTSHSDSRRRPQAAAAVPLVHCNTAALNPSPGQADGYVIRAWQHPSSLVSPTKTAPKFKSFPVSVPFEQPYGSNPEQVTRPLPGTPRHGVSFYQHAGFGQPATRPGAHSPALQVRTAGVLDRTPLDEALRGNPRQYSGQCFAWACCTTAHPAVFRPRS